MAATGLHISLSAEPLFNVAGLTITNSMFTSVVVSVLLITFALLVRASFSETNKPTGLQNFAEWIIEMLYNFVDGITGSAKKTQQFFPFIASFFLFILVNNWFGLLPGVGSIGILVDNPETSLNEEVAETSRLASQAQAATEEEHLETKVSTVDEHAMESHSEAGEFVPLFRAGTADLNTTLALALITQFLAQWFGFSYQGFGYLGKFFNFKNPMLTFVGLLELIGELTKIISFAFRLFGNIFAGEVLLIVIGSLLAVIAPMPFYGLELFVGAIQALVFAMLSLVFYNIATMGHGEEH